MPIVEKTQKNLNHNSYKWITREYSAHKVKDQITEINQKQIINYIAQCLYTKYSTNK